jgi:hypothetical protein
MRGDKGVCMTNPNSFFTAYDIKKTILTSGNWQQIGYFVTPYII